MQVFSNNLCSNFKFWNHLYRIFQGPTRTRDPPLGSGLFFSFPRDSGQVSGLGTRSSRFLYSITVFLASSFSIFSVSHFPFHQSIWDSQSIHHGSWADHGACCHVDSRDGLGLIDQILVSVVNTSIPWRNWKFSCSNEIKSREYKALYHLHRGSQENISLQILIAKIWLP